MGTEQLQAGIAVAAGIVAQHLVVGAVLAHHVEDVLDRAVGPDWGVGRRTARVDRANLARGDTGELPQARVAGEVEDAGVAGDQVGQVGHAVGVVVGGSQRRGAVRVGTDAQPLGGDVDQPQARARPGPRRAALGGGGHVSGVVGGGDAPDQLVGGPAAAPGQPEHGDLVGAGLRHQQAAAVRRDADVHRRRAQALGPVDGERALDLEPLGVDHRHLVGVGDRDVGPIGPGVDRDRLGMRQVRPDLDVLDLARGRQVDDRDRAVRLVGDQPGAPVAGDRRPVGIMADVDVAHLLAVGVDDRRGVGQVQRDQQGMPVGRHRQAVGPGEPLGVGGREVLGRPA